MTLHPPTGARLRACVRRGRRRECGARLYILLQSACGDLNFLESHFG